MTKIFLYLLTTLTLSATCLEGRYHLEARTGLRHHRHDRHLHRGELWENDEIITRGGSAKTRNRNNEDDDDNNNENDGESLTNNNNNNNNNFFYKEKPSTTSVESRRAVVSAAASYDRRNNNFGWSHRRGIRYDSQRGRNGGRHRVRDEIRRPAGGAAATTTTTAAVNPWRNSVQEISKGRNRRPHKSESSSSSSSSSSSFYGRPRSYRNPSRLYDDVKISKSNDRGRSWLYDYNEEEGGYEADDEEEEEEDEEEEFYQDDKKSVNRYAPRYKGRRKYHRSDNRADDHRRRRINRPANMDDDYADDYESRYDFEDEVATMNPPRRGYKNRGSKKQETLPEGRRRPVDEDVGRRRGGRKKWGNKSHYGDVKPSRGKAEDFNEVEDIDELQEDDIWENPDDDDDDDEDEDDDEDYDEEFESNEENNQSSMKTIDDVIRKLSAADTATTTTTTTLKPSSRRDYRNIENDPKTASGVQQPQRINSKRTTAAWIATSTVRPAFYAKQNVNTSRNEIGSAINKKLNTVENSSSSLITRNAEVDAKTKSFEQLDYDDYENDGVEDRQEKSDDVDGEKEKENEKKWISDKNRNYEDENVEDNDEEDERSAVISTTTQSFSSTNILKTTTPAPISTKSLFDHRLSRNLETRNRANGLKNVHLNSTDYPPMSNYSSQKWNNLGSRKAVSNYRNSGKELDKSDTKNAIKHVRKMNREALCRWPRPKVISVRDVHPSPSKTYNPPCTILHRCADDTGCCRSEGTCVPKHSHHVELSFYVSVIGRPTHVEKLMFDNHTECECRPRPRPEPPTPPPPPPPKPCKCPSRFVPETTSDGKCNCNCQDNYLPCLRLRRGKEYFNNDDRWCIHNDECTPPNCEFGKYLRRQARCPNLMERFGAVDKYSNPNDRY